jgi:hypothetical protein
MCVGAEPNGETVAAQRHGPGETAVARRELWETIRRVAETGGLSVRPPVRRFELDREIIRRCLQASAWQPWHRAPRGYAARRARR